MPKTLMNDRPISTHGTQAVHLSTPNSSFRPQTKLVKSAFNCSTRFSVSKLLIVDFRNGLE